MIYDIVNIGGKDYKLRLTAAKAIEVEKTLGTNPLNVFTKMKTTNEFPCLRDMLTIFWGALTYYQHGITKEAVYALYDQYIEEGHGLEDFFNDILARIFKSAGYIKDEETEDEIEEDIEKNE